MMENKKIIENSITVLNSKLATSKVDDSQKRFKLSKGKRLKVVFTEKRLYLFKIMYEAFVEVKEGDFLINDNGVVFGVLKSNDLFSLITTIQGQKHEPIINKNLKILQKP